MHVRVLESNFDRITTPYWAENKEFALLYSAASVCPAHVEPFLVKVMTMAKKMLSVTAVKLHEDVRIFNLQEMQHCKQHIAFNKIMRKSFPEVERIEDAYAADYDRLLKTKSLQFNLAYCEGFEANTAISIQSFFENFDDYWAGSDPQAEALWKWHMAEEHEHREVISDTYHALYGRGFSAYLYRIYGFIYSCWHIMKYVNAVSKLILAEYRKDMTADELRESKIREKDINRLAWKSAFYHIRKILSPFYDPAKRQAPRGVAEILARGSGTIPIAAPLAYE